MDTRIGLALLALACFTPHVKAAEPSKQELVSLLKEVDERQRNVGDVHSSMYMEQKEKGKLTVVYEAQAFRRGAEGQFVILFTAPKGSQGQGYLRIDKNLWFYDPSVGKWERRTERERIGGTNSRRADFDDSRLADEYEPAYLTTEKLGAYDTIVLKLTGRPGLDLAFPSMKLWIDKETKNVLKREEYATSGRLLRTGYFPKWKKVYSASKRGDVWFPEETRIYDEVEKENSTVMLVRNIDLKQLDATIFSKAWLESKSR